MMRSYSCCALVACAVASTSCKAREPSPAAPPSTAAPAAAAGEAKPVALPGGGSGIGFDDLVFAPRLRKVLAPAGATGNLALVDPDTAAVTPIAGFAATAGASGDSHENGTTSADEGDGVVFAIDRTSGKLVVVDPNAKKIVASAKLGGSPDYVRWVASAREVWVTEPDSEQIEVFAVPPGGAPTRASVIAVKGGPESLVVDDARKKAFSHLWSGATVAIDVPAHRVAATWPNGCKGSRGIALDHRRGWIVAGCSEGKLVVLDAEHDGKELGSVTTGAGVDVIAYNESLGHAYAPGARSATMAIVAIGNDGKPTVLGTVETAPGAHCVAADDRNHAWVCDVRAGRLLMFTDRYPASGG